MEIREKDERSQLIREKAAAFSFEVSSGVLAVAFYCAVSSGFCTGTDCSGCDFSLPNGRLYRTVFLAEQENVKRDCAERMCWSYETRCGEMGAVCPGRSRRAGPVSVCVPVREEIPRSVNGLCSGLGGALIGIGGAGLIIPLLMRSMTPEDRKEVERAERDERSVAIRAHAAQDSWYWSLYLLWVPFIVSMVQGELLWMVLCPAVIVLHCAFYMFHMYRWSKKL